MRALITCFALALSLGCSAEVNEVGLILPPNGALGLQCVDSVSGRLLIDERRQIDGGRARISVTVDYIGFEGVPSCRPIQLLEWCRTRGCPIQRRWRSCDEVVLEEPIPSRLLEIQQLVAEQLALQDPITVDPPDGVVLIRMTVSNQTCAALGEGPHRCDDLLGCVYSCPVQLDEVRGDILLELDSLGDTCDEQIVGICAGIGFEGDGMVEGCQP